MRRLAAIILSAAVFAAGIYAYTDSFAATSSNPAYSALIDAVKNGKEEETVAGLYQEYMDESLTMTEMARIEYHMARYFKDMGNTTEVVTYKGENGMEAIKFIYVNQKERIKVEYTGGKPYVIYIADGDKRAIAATYDLATVLSDVENMRTLKAKSEKKIAYLKAKLTDDGE